MKQIYENEEIRSKTKKREKKKIKDMYKEMLKHVIKEGKRKRKKGGNKYMITKKERIGGDDKK